MSAQAAPLLVGGGSLGRGGTKRSAFSGRWLVAGRVLTWQKSRKTGGLGLEHDANGPKFPEKQNILPPAPAPVPPNSLRDCDLALIVGRWPSLPEHIRLAIVAMVKTGEQAPCRLSPAGDVLRQGRTNSGSALDTPWYRTPSRSHAPKPDPDPSTSSK